MVTQGTARRRITGQIGYMRDATFGAAVRVGARPVLLAKNCSQCGRGLQDPCRFSKSVRNPDGLQAACKDCNAQWQKDNPEKRRDTWRRYRRASYYLQTYGITIEQYWEIYKAQDCCCAICHVHGDDAGQHTFQQLPLHVDHDHQTGRVRGLLCRPCNMMLGSARDQAENLEAGARYLRGSESLATVVASGA